MLKSSAIGPTYDRNDARTPGEPKLPAGPLPGAVLEVA
jgi:hypothetical protein